MRRLSIEAFEDRSSPGRGHAVVLLRGLEQLPEPAIFRLNIIDRGTADGAAPRLSAGDLTPSAVRRTPEGIALVVGPDITGCPQLLPGTAVEIEVPAAAVRGGFLWPAIEPPIRSSGMFRIFHRTSGPTSSDIDARAPILLPTHLPGPHGTEAAEAGHGRNGHAHKNGLPIERDQAGAMRWQPANGRTRDILAPLTDHASSTSAGSAQAGPFTRWGPFCAAVVAAVVAIEVVLLAVHDSRPAVRMSGSRAPVRAPAEPTELSSLMFQDWLRAGSPSPRGVAVAGVTPEDALSRANAHLTHGPRGRDTAEGAFWLKHYLSATAGETAATRALTQLGFAYAEPTSGTADHVRARHLWEVAAALGDPAAMCALGAMFSKGLGVVADAAVGANWMERARRAGGCDDAPSGERR